MEVTDGAGAEEAVGLRTTTWVTRTYTRGFGGGERRACSISMRTRPESSGGYCELSSFGAHSIHPQ